LLWLRWDRSLSTSHHRSFTRAVRDPLLPSSRTT
jgi:hypothetical protein